MQGINLHALVRSSINIINPDETVMLYQSVGQVNIDGVVRPRYMAGQEITAQWQPLDKDQMRREEKGNDNKDALQVFLYSDTDKPIADIRRKPLARGGDMIKRGEEWYLVTAVLEDWSPIGWTNVEATLQTKAPDFTASLWRGKGANHGT